MSKSLTAAATPAEHVERSRNVVAMYGLTAGHGSLGLALAICMASGLTSAEEIAKAFIDTDDGVKVNPLAPALPIEAVDMYPDAIAVLDDGSLLVCDVLAGLAVGDAYRDTVLVSERTVEHSGERPAPADVDDGTHEGNEAAKAIQAEEEWEAADKAKAEPEPAAA